MPDEPATVAEPSPGETSAIHPGAAACANHNRPVFVIGCERSGTTLLRAMLTAHPHIAIPYEAERLKHLFPKPWKLVWTRKDVPQAVETFLSHPNVRFWKLETQAVLRELGTDEHVSFAEVVRATYRAYARGQGKPRWGDKTTKNTFDALRIARMYPEAQFVHIVRDGRDVYLSWLNVDWKSRPLDESAVRWATWVWAAAQGERLGRDRYCVLLYEDLLARPRAELQRLCRFLGEPFAPEMLEYHKLEGLVPEKQRAGVHRLVSTPPDGSRAFGWRRALPNAERRTFDRIAGAMLVKYGYDVRWPLRPVAQAVLAIREIGRRGERVRRASRLRPGRRTVR